MPVSRDYDDVSVPLVSVLVSAPVLEPELSVLVPKLVASPSLELSTTHVSPTVPPVLVPAGRTQKPSTALHSSPSQHDASSMHHSSSASSGTHDGTHTDGPIPSVPAPAPGS
jgi:hypothetical protein